MYFFPYSNPIHMTHECALWLPGERYENLAYNVAPTPDVHSEPVQGATVERTGMQTAGQMRVCRATGRYQFSSLVLGRFS